MTEKFPTKSSIVLTGPTGTGKTPYIDSLAKELPIEVINMDSCQVFAFFCVGTGRADGHPSVPRHLFGVLHPYETFDSNTHIRRAEAVVNEVLSRGRIPLFEGGSRSLLPLVLERFQPHAFCLEPPFDEQWILDRLRRRAEGFLENDALIREVREGLRLGYGDCRLMKDPMIYMQTRDYLDGKISRGRYLQSMVTSMKAMHDDQRQAFRGLALQRTAITQVKPSELAQDIASNFLSIQ